MTVTASNFSATSPPSIIQAAVKGNAGGTRVSFQFLNSIKSGDIIVVIQMIYFASGSPNMSAPTDSLNDTYVLDRTFTFSIGLEEVFSTIPSNNAYLNVSFGSISGCTSQCNLNLAMYEIKSGSYDFSASNAGPGPNIDLGSNFNPPLPGAIIVAGIDSSSAISQYGNGAGYTITQDSQNGGTGGCASGEYSDNIAMATNAPYLATDGGYDWIEVAVFLK